MNRRRGRRFAELPPAARALLWASLLVLAGCGYTLEGTRKPAHLKGIRSIGIPVFTNKTSEPGLETTVTNAVRNRFLLDGRLQVTNPSEADIVLDGVLHEYLLEPIGFSRQDQVRRYRVFIRTIVQVRDVRRNTFILNQEIDSESEFDISESISASETSRQDTNSAVAARFSEELVSLVLEGF